MTFAHRVSIVAVCICLSAGGAIAQGSPFAEEAAALRGTVTEVETGRGLEGVRVHLHSRLTPPAAVTDASGSFVVVGLAPGSYRVFAEREGMVFTGDCRFQPELPCMELTLSTGQTAEVEMRMRRAATLSGQVVDEAGDPVVGVRVSLQRYDYASVPGARVLVDFPTPSEFHTTDLLDCRTRLYEAGSLEGPIAECNELAADSQVGRSVTNDQGEWRLSGVPPGEYYVVVSADTRAALDRAIPNLQAGAWLPVYYPGTAFADRAAPVRVTSVPDVAGIDIRWSERSPVAIRGAVTRMPETRRPALQIGGVVFQPNGLNVRITTADGLPVPTAPSGLPVHSAQVNTLTGEFEFLVPPSAEYILTATVESHGGRLRVNVGTADVEDIVLPLSPAAEVRGQFLFDPPPDPEDISGVWVRFSYDNALGSTEVGSPVSPDGSFVLRQSDTVRWDGDMSVGGLPEGYYLESAGFGGVDLLREAFNPIDAPGSVIVIRVGDSPAAVTGRVLDRRGEPFEGARVTLVPDGSLRGRRDLYKAAATDTEGRFTLEAVPPGTYRAFAWESIPEGAERSADFLAPYLGSGRFLTLDASAATDIELRLIEP